MRVYLAPPEELRRKWKVQRDCSRRGYTTDQVLAELDKREPDSAEFIRPQQRHADIVVSFLPGRDDQEHLDAEIVLRSSLRHPDLREVLNGALNQGIKLTERDGEAHMFIPGTFDRELAERLEETIWERLHFASHLRTDRLGEFTIGTELHRSESLALIQLLILYHLFTATASVALGGEGTREPDAGRTSPGSRRTPRRRAACSFRAIAASVSSHPADRARVPDRRADEPGAIRAGRPSRGRRPSREVLAELLRRRPRRGRRELLDVESLRRGAGEA